LPTLQTNKRKVRCEKKPSCGK